MKKKKGFTLTELIIVLAIIAILSAIIFPSWAYAMARARTKSQNNNSKVIFNAAQTAAIRMNFQERKVKDEGDKFMGSGDFILYWDRGTAYAAKSSDPADLATSDEATAFAQEINNIFSGNDETVYKIYIKNYNVEAVCSGRTDGDRYIGAYPTTTLNMEKSQKSAISAAGVKNVSMGQFLLHPVAPAPPADEDGT